MKKLILLALIILPTLSFAGDIQVKCGELIRYKSGSKSVLKFPASILIPLRLPAIKVKLRNVSSFTKMYGSQEIIGSPVRKEKIKLGYTDEANRAKHLLLLKEAKEEMKKTNLPAHICFGEVKGLDRWHKILNYSMDSSEEAFTELVRKYQ